VGLFGRLLGYPDIDPTGRSRELFEKVGQQTMTMFFRGDAERAFQHPQQLMAMVAKKHGPYHADVGRANLLGSALMAMTAQYEFALQTCDAALKALKENEDVAGVDIEAAEFLKAGLEKLAEGQHPVVDGEGYLIDKDTPIGKWLWRLRS
jgi:hypothetical protein